MISGSSRAFDRRPLTYETPHLERHRIADLPHAAEPNTANWNVDNEVQGPPLDWEQLNSP